MPRFRLNRPSKQDRDKCDKRDDKSKQRKQRKYLSKSGELSSGVTSSSCRGCGNELYSAKFF
jgi:hypothetical protein